MTTQNNDTFHDTFDEDEFDDSLFNDIDTDKHIKHGKKKWNFHILFFVVIAALFLFAIVRLLIWNIGKSSGYDPNEDTSEFDTEPLDYIQPLNKEQLNGKPEDGVTTIFCLGNSPFSDNGADNTLTASIADAMDAVTVNVSFADSFMSQKNASYDDSYPADGISLYEVTKALTSGDFSTVERAAAAISEEASAQAEYMKTLDLSTADMVVIMYDLSDYIDHRPVMDPNDPNNLLTCNGCLNASVAMIQEKYPYIRIVVLSTPACGKTIDNFYVDGDVQDLGNGTLTDYLANAANVAISNGVSFIDTYFGVITTQNRDQYLIDDYHLNEAGSKAIAARLKKLISIS